LNGLATAAGQFIHRSFSVVVNDGQLNVQIASTGGDPYFTINALEVFAWRRLLWRSAGTFGTADGNPGHDHGQRYDCRAVYTVTADLGTIQGTDDSTAYAGFQVQASGTSFSFICGARPASAAGGRRSASSR
jgi:hypothetical protein